MVTAIFTGVLSDYWLNEAIPLTLELFGYKIQIACLWEDGAFLSSANWLKVMEDAKARAVAAENNFVNMIKIMI